MGPLDRVLKRTAPSEEDLTNEALRANGLLQQAEQAATAEEAFPFLREYRAVVRASAQEDVYDVDGSNEILGTHLLAAVEKRGMTYKELLFEDGAETLQKAVEREFTTFKEKANGSLTLQDNAAIRWHAMRHAYEAVCGYVIGGLQASLDENKPATVVSDHFYNFFTQRINYLKELGTRLMADDSQLSKRFEQVGRARQDIEEQIREALEEQHDKVYEAFQGATMMDEALPAFVTMMGMSIQYQRLLDVNPHKLIPDATAKFAELGAQLLINEEGALVIRKDSNEYVPTFPPVSEWSQQTNGQQLPLHRPQSAHPAVADSEQEEYPVVPEGYNHREKSAPPKKNGRLERALDTIGRIAVVAALGGLATYMLYTRLGTPSAPSMEQRVSQLPPLEITPAQEAEYVRSFHHAAQQRAYFDLRQAGWCPTEQALRQLAVPSEAGRGELRKELVSWEDMHSKRAELLKEFAQDPVYRCR